MPKRNPDERSTILALWEQSKTLFKEARALLRRIEQLETKWLKATEAELEFRFELNDLVDFDNGPRLLTREFRQAQTSLQQAHKALERLVELEGERALLLAQAKQLHTQLAQPLLSLWRWIDRYESGHWGADARGNFLPGPLSEREWEKLLASDEDGDDVEYELANFAGVRSINT